MYDKNFLYVKIALKILLFFLKCIRAIAYLRAKCKKMENIFVAFNLKTLYSFRKIVINKYFHL